MKTSNNKRVNAKHCVLQAPLNLIKVFFLIYCADAVTEANKHQQKHTVCNLLNHESDFNNTPVPSL